MKDDVIRDVGDVRVAALQYLQSLRRAGMTHLPRATARLEITDLYAPVVDSSLPQADTAARTSARPVTDRQPVSAPARAADRLMPGERPSPPAAPSPAAKLSVQRESIAANATPPLRGQPTTLPEGSKLTRNQREDRLKALACRVAECRRCEDLAETRTQTVFGVGNPEARIMFIGEAPGADEDRQGIPFVGKAGQLLTRIIEACQLKREDIYICNVLRCRPPGNRTPTPAEATNCREYLDGQIAVVDPDYIVCWGNVAAQNLLDTKVPMGRMRQKFHQYGRAKVLCTYHPSYLLRNPPAKKEVWEDMQFFFRDMGIELKNTAS